MKRLLVVALGTVLCAAGLAGCRGPLTVESYSDAKPGPWKPVKISLAVTADKGARMTVKVVDYAASPSDYVQKFELVDDRKITVGGRVFSHGEEPEETFLLGPTSRTVVVTITSTGRGTWRSGPVTIPAPPPGPVETPK